MTRVAIIGMGLMGTLHARAFQDMPGVEVALAVDIDPARRAVAEQELAVPTSEALRDDHLDAVDAVSVTLPDHLHVDACVQALRRGRDVLVEKPLATTTRMCEVILAAEAEPGSGRLMVGHVLRFDLRLQELRRRVAAGDLGRLRYVRIHRANGTSTPERFGNAVSVTSFLGVHDLDLLLWITGQRIVDVRARGARFMSSVWDLAVAHLELTGGVHAVVENHWLVNDHSARSCLAGVQVFGEDGMATIDLSTDELELTTSAAARSRRIDTHNWTHDLAVSGGSLRRELEAFVRSVAGGDAMPVTGADGMRAVEAVQLVESALDG